MDVICRLSSDRILTRIKRPSYDANAILASHTIYGALFNCAVKIGNKKLLDALRSGKVLVSSLYPGVVQNGKDVFLIPKPLLVPQMSVDKIKSFKKLKYILLGDLESWQADGAKVRLDSVPDVPKVSGNGSIRVTIDRLTNSTVPFTDESYVFYKGKFAYFFASFPDELKEDVLSLFNLMIYEGLGGDRTVGFGIFERCEVVPVRIGKDTGVYVSLSQFIPCSNERNMLITWEIVEHGGTFIYKGGGTTLLKPLYRLCKEGTVTKGKVKGCMKTYEVPGHSDTFVFYARAYLLPIGGKVCIG